MAFEIKQYSSDTCEVEPAEIRRYETKYTELITAMKRAEGNWNPLVPCEISPLHEAQPERQAIAGLSEELITVETNVTSWSATWRSPSPRPMRSSRRSSLNDLCALCTQG